MNANSKRAVSVSVLRHHTTVAIISSDCYRSYSLQLLVKVINKNTRKGAAATVDLLTTIVLPCVCEISRRAVW